MGVPVAPRAFCSGKNRRCTGRATHRGLCDECYLAKQREYDEGRPSAAERGYDTAWRITRAAFLEDHPLCMSDECGALPLWRRPEATDVDHIDGLGPLGPRGHDPTNLRALCHSCHSKRTARDQPGGWNRRKGLAA